MPDTIINASFGIDWNHDAQPEWQSLHDRFAADMDEALDNLEAKPECPHCHGYGYRMVTDDRRPWREYRSDCFECTGG